MRVIGEGLYKIYRLSYGGTASTRVLCIFSARCQRSFERAWRCHISWQNAANVGVDCLRHRNREYLEGYAGGTYVLLPIFRYRTYSAENRNRIDRECAKTREDFCQKPAPKFRYRSGMALRVSKAGGSEATLILLRDDTPATSYSKVVLLPCDSTIAAVDLWAFECAAPGLILRGSTFRP